MFLTAFLVAFGAHPVLEPLASATDPPKSGTCYREEKRGTAYVRDAGT